MIEQELLYKWRNGSRSNQKIGLGDVFRLCQDIVDCLGDEGTAELGTPKGSEFSYYVITLAEESTRNIRGMWIHGVVYRDEVTLETETEEAENDLIVASFLLEKISRRGRERFSIFTDFAPVYSPLTGTVIGENTLYPINLGYTGTTTLFRGIRAALFNTVINENIV
jgi:hypothetical protein